MNTKEEYLFDVLDYITTTAREKGKTLDVSDLVRELEDIKDFCSEFTNDETEKDEIRRLAYNLSKSAEAINPYAAQDNLDTVSYYEFRDQIIDEMKRSLGADVVRTEASGLRMVLNKNTGRVSLYFKDKIDQSDLDQTAALSCYRNYSAHHESDSYAAALTERFIKNNVPVAPRNTLMFYTSDEMMEAIAKSIDDKERGDAASYQEFGVAQIGDVRTTLSFRPLDFNEDIDGVSIVASFLYPVCEGDESRNGKYEMSVEYKSAYGDLSEESIIKEIKKIFLEDIKDAFKNNKAAFETYKESILSPTRETTLDYKNQLYTYIKKEPFTRRKIDNEEVLIPSWIAGPKKNLLSKPVPAQKR